MTLNKITALLLEPRGARYIGRHRAPERARVVAVASVSRPPVDVVPITD